MYKFSYNFLQPGKRGGLSTGAVFGIVAGAIIFAAFLLLFVLWWNGCLRLESTLELASEFRKLVDPNLQIERNSQYGSAKCLLTWSIPPKFPVFYLFFFFLKGIESISSMLIM